MQSRPSLPTRPLFLLLCFPAVTAKFNYLAYESVYQLPVPQKLPLEGKLIGAETECALLTLVSPASGT